jgi:hypothetical protein
MHIVQKVTLSQIGEGRHSFCRSFDMALTLADVAQGESLSTVVLFIH